MDEADAGNYWCHMCNQIVNPIMELEIELKCPFCQSGFIEIMDANTRQDQDTESDLGSERALSLWAPILLGMMSNPRRGRRRRLRREDILEDDVRGGDEDESGETDLDREFESFMRRRGRRSSASILQMLQGIRAGIGSESENSENDRGGERDRDRDRDRDREGVILINPFNQTIIVQGSYDGANQNQTPVGSLGDYFIGPGLELLLQHLAENDPNRYGTPPAKKEAIEEMPTVKIKENLQCSVCLDDFEVGTEAKEMPCKHKFHSGCILPWLELHSSCPICRFQVAADESKLDADGSRSSSRRESNNADAGGEEGDVDIDGDGDGDGDGRSGNSRRFSVPWPFASLFSSQNAGNSNGNGNGNSSSSSSSSGNAHSHPDEH